MQIKKLIAKIKKELAEHSFMDDQEITQFEKFIDNLAKQNEKDKRKKM